MALWRSHLMAGSLFTSAVFLARLLCSVDLYDAICCRIVSILRLSECVIKNIIIIVYYYYFHSYVVFSNAH